MLRIETLLPGAIESGKKDPDHGAAKLEQEGRQRSPPCLVCWCETVDVLDKRGFGMARTQYLRSPPSLHG